MTRASDPRRGGSGQGTAGDDGGRAARLAAVAPADPLTPSERYQELFVAVQCGRVFDDSKTFVDCAPVGSPSEILEAYRGQRERPDFDLSAFVHAHFRPEDPPRHRYVSDPGQPLPAHIAALWDVLTRHPHEHPAGGSLLPLPNDYLVPGGRFGELYYWDSYFTMLGLAPAGRHDLLRAMADNFAWLIDTYGHVPNGNRTYYLSRSHPPVFALMVDLFERHCIAPALRYLPQLRCEHAFWMTGAEDLAADEAAGHCVRMADGSVLNRYWDARDIPREEAWLEDVTTAGRSPRPDNEVCRDLRAAAASGWDFSARWFDTPDGALSSTRTTSIVPVDLNALLYKLETQIATLARAIGRQDVADGFAARARARREAMERWLWDEQVGAWCDYDLLRGCPRDFLSAATAVPLYVGASDPRRTARVAELLRATLLEPGGLATSRQRSGQQWDAPNGWAPLQWLAIGGLVRGGHGALANEIAHRWLATVGSLYCRESRLVEKYVLRHTAVGAIGGGGGEYPLQDGFGWTNGVTARLLDDYPDNPACRAEAGRRAPEPTSKGVMAAAQSAAAPGRPARAGRLCPGRPETP